MEQGYIKRYKFIFRLIRLSFCLARLTGGLDVALQRLTEIAAGNSFVLSLIVDF